MVIDPDSEKNIQKLLQQRFDRQKPQEIKFTDIDNQRLKDQGHLVKEGDTEHNPIGCPHKRCEWIVKHNSLEQSSSYDQAAKYRDLENRFRHHAPQDLETVQSYEQMREACLTLAYFISDTVPEGREKSLALTNLEQVMFWANAGIARY